jgi:hypothetical protein
MRARIIWERPLTTLQSSLDVPHHAFVMHLCKRKVYGPAIPEFHGPTHKASVQAACRRKLFHAGFLFEEFHFMSPEVSAECALNLMPLLQYTLLRICACHLHLCVVLLSLKTWWSGPATCMIPDLIHGHNIFCVKRQSSKQADIVGFVALQNKVRHPR